MKMAPWNYNKTFVNREGNEIAGDINKMTKSGRYYTPEELREAKQNRDSQMPLKNSTTNDKVEDLFKKVKSSEYSIVDQLWKTPSQTSLLSLLLSSDDHQKVLFNTLNEAYVPDVTPMAHL